MTTTRSAPRDLSDWEEAVVEIAEIRETLTRLVEDRPEGSVLEQFADGVLETLESMAVWIEANSRVTTAQLAAIENIAAGVAKWER